MRASAFEFRFRVWVMVAIVFVGFWSPWIEWANLGSRTHAWTWLGAELATFGLSSLTGIELVTFLVIAVAAAGAAVRIWGTAYLGTGVVHNAQMKAGDSTAGQVLADGPYRFMRNPLYLGSYLTMAAISVLMPPSGAAVCLVLMAFFLLRLILGEEAFLAPRLGEPYLAYCKAVPRLIPSLWPRVPKGTITPHWGRAFLAEIMPLGVLASFAALSWQYPERLTQAVLISFGLSLVSRALTMSKPDSTQPAL
jgi:protein-S-isoprenylcysteine O-methyltransferase Ste14